MIKDIGINLFYALVVETFVLIAFTLIKDDTRKKIIVLLLGTFFAGMVGFSDIITKSFGIDIASGESGCKAWNLAFDFRTYPHQENPNRDSCGNQNVWYFFESSSLERTPSNYTLLPNFVADVFGVPGYQEWQGSHRWANRPNVFFPSVGINTTNETKTIETAVHPSKSITVHPWGTKGLIIIGWRSPIDGFVSISGFVNDLDSFRGGDGISWFIDKENQTLASGYFEDGGDQPFLDGAGYENLKNVGIIQDEFIYFIVHPNANDLYDTTWVDIQLIRH